MDAQKLKDFIFSEYDNNAIPVLEDYIRIPNTSRSYDPEWNTNGLLEKAARLLYNWAEKQNIKGMTMDFKISDGRTPLIFLQIKGQVDKNILMYGHMDKQPHMTGWNEGLSPVIPVIKDGKLYGRGGADDGYAIFAAILSIKALQEQNLPHPNITILIEGDEESASFDLPYYIEMFRPKIGNPDLIICLDSGAMDYERLWVTCSLRGIMTGVLKVQVLNEGVHSGDGSGVVPSSFRLLRQLLDRIENSETGRMHKSLQVEIPSDRYAQCVETARVCDKTVFGKYPWHGNTHCYEDSKVEAYLNRCWRPQLSVVGVEGIPSLECAGNVLRAYTAVKLSIRLPPTQNGPKAAEWVKKTLETNPPQGCTVTFDVDDIGEGWNAPESTEQMIRILKASSQTFYNQPVAFQGEGGSIPFMKMLGDMFPKAQFAILGVLGPNSNAHGPNEFLHIDMAKRLTCCVADIVYRFNDSS